MPQAHAEIGIKVKEFGNKFKTTALFGKKDVGFSDAHLLKIGGAVLFPDHFLSNIGASIRFAVPIKLTHQ